jgi:FlaA1/EpsC-like NDP-sugar epimerase
MDLLKLIYRDRTLFDQDLLNFESSILDAIGKSCFLVIGGAGSIGQAVVKEIFKRKPRVLHVVDISENNLVELVRDIRSSLGYIDGDFETLPLDCGSVEFDAFVQSKNKYDYILNLSALKHVRSEKDPYTLMRMIDVNILNAQKTLLLSIGDGAKYFCVSTDKATNPVSMMGASKRIMELFLMRASLNIVVSTSRFANVAFSDGSLLHGFDQRIKKRQPLSAPQDVKRYFVTPEEAGILSLMSCILGENRDIFFPKLSEELHQVAFKDIAIRYLDAIGYEAYPCETEEEARRRVEELIRQKKWPCYFFDSDTTGEKDFEEFYTGKEMIDWDRFIDIGIIKNEALFDDEKLRYFESTISELKLARKWTKQDLVDLFSFILPEFQHMETHKYLDQRM